MAAQPSNQPKPEPAGRQLLNETAGQQQARNAARKAWVDSRTQRPRPAK